MKLRFLLALGLMAAITNTQETTLPLYAQTSHFNVYCAPMDDRVAGVLLKQSAETIKQLAHDFKHCYSNPITIIIYPDIVAFHQAIKHQNAPQWIVGSTMAHTSLIVSPDNPGKHHSYESILRINRANITALFIQDTYKNHSIPPWLRTGVSLYKAPWPPAYNKLSHLIQTPAEIPTIAHLETIPDDYHAFDQVHGFYIAPSMVEFIVHKWGWNTMLKLLDNYAAFEEILGLSKDEFRTAWITFVQQHN